MGARPRYAAAVVLTATDRRIKFGLENPVELIAISDINECRHTVLTGEAELRANR